MISLVSCLVAVESPIAARVSVCGWGPRVIELSVVCDFSRMWPVCSSCGTWGRTEIFAYRFVVRPCHTRERTGVLARARPRPRARARTHSAQRAGETDISEKTQLHTRHTHAHTPHELSAAPFCVFFARFLPRPTQSPRSHTLTFPVKDGISHRRIIHQPHIYL